MIDGNKLEELLSLLSAAPGGDRILKRLSISSYNSFVLTVHKDIDEIVLRMERNRHRFENMSEDELTFHISSVLEGMGYTSSCGKQSSGSVDLTVEMIHKNYLWTAEAKIFNKIGDVEEGFRQLTTRYSPGDFEEAKAGMLIYMFAGDSAGKMKAWRSHVEGLNVTDLKTMPCLTRPNMAFKSTHKHESSGLSLNVRHMGVTLKFMPQDKSARNSKIGRRRLAKAS